MAEQADRRRCAVDRAAGVGHGEHVIVFVEGRPVADLDGIADESRTFVEVREGLELAGREHAACPVNRVFRHVVEEL